MEWPKNLMSTTAAPTPATTTPAATTQASVTPAATEQAAATQAAMASSFTEKLAVGMDDLMEAWESAIESPLNVPVLVEAIKDLDELSTEVANDNNIPEHNTMRLLDQFLTQLLTLDNVTVMDFVHTKLVNMGEGQESVKKDKWSYPETYH